MKEIFTPVSQDVMEPDTILVVAYISAFAIRQHWPEDARLNQYFIGKASKNFDHDIFAKPKPRQFGMGTPGYMIVRVNREQIEAAKYRWDDPANKIEILEYSRRFLYNSSDHKKSFKLRDSDIFVDDAGCSLQKPRTMPGASTFSFSGRL